MPTKKDIPVEMEKVHRQFQRWRRQRRGREPIPVRLWTAAARSAVEYGVNPTAKALSLDFNKLKAHVKRKREVKKGNLESAPQFLELVASPSGSTALCGKHRENRRLTFLRFRANEEVDYDTFGRKDTQGGIRLHVFSLHTHERKRFRCGRVMPAISARSSRN